MTDKNNNSTDSMMNLAGHKHLPNWFRMVMAAFLVPPLMLVLSFFFLTKFTGLEQEFKMIAEGYAYQLTGGPVNTQSTEMGQMVSILESQLDVINDLRSENAKFRDEMMAGVNRIGGQVEGLGVRLSTLERWAVEHSNDGKVKFGVD